MKYTRGTDTSYALTEVRTILSRAETSLAYLHRDKANDGQAFGWRSGTYETDPEIDQMIEALGEVVRILDRWRRTGRK